VLNGEVLNGEEEEEISDGRERDSLGKWPLKVVVIVVNGVHDDVHQAIQFLDILFHHWCGLLRHAIVIPHRRFLETVQELVLQFLKWDHLSMLLQ